MKKLLLLFTLVYVSASAQKLSCCTMSVNDKNSLLAMNENFASAHLAPLPFVLEKPKGTIIAFKTTTGENAHAYLVKSGTETHKVLFIYHEWWGLNDYIKQEAEKIQAELGDVNVYALDLYDGKVATETPEAQKYMSQLQDDKTKALIAGAVKYVGENARIASLGWCMGGAWSLQSAIIEGKQAVGCVMYYGMPETDVNKLKTLNCDVLGIFGAQDNFINPDVVRTFEENMKKAGKKITTHSFDAVHAFANPSNPKYNKEFAETAHQEAMVYLKGRFK